MTALDILVALRQKDYHTANQGFARVMQEKLADRLAVEKRNVTQQALTEVIAEATMSAHEVQRVYNEIGDVGEVELLCGISGLRVNENGQVITYVTEAISRPNTSGQGYDDDYMHNPYHGVIRKYGYEYSHSTPVTHGNEKITHHTYKQGTHNVSVWGNNWSTSTGTASGRQFSGGHPNTARAEGDLERHLRDKARRYGLTEDVFGGAISVMSGWDKCDKCEKTANWRGKDPKTGIVLASACYAHKDVVKNALIQKLQGVK